jgi:hypothetical protein
MSVPTGAQYELFRVLIHGTERAPNLTARARRLGQLLLSERRLRRWARACPANFSAHHQLARAITRTRSRKAHLEAALECAKRHGQPMIEALALEQLARAEVHPERAQTLRQRARAAYTRWGAGASIIAADPSEGTTP